MEPPHSLSVDWIIAMQAYKRARQGEVQMKPIPIPMPGAQRLRNLQLLIDGDGGCSLVYDVERAVVFEVPEDLRLHVAPALETGDLDEDLLGWLVGEDLLTSESWSGWSGQTSWNGLGPGWDDVAFDGAPGRDGELRIGLAGPAWGGDEVHGWIDQSAEGAALDAVEMLFKRGFARSRLKVHLDWNGLLPPAGLLEKVVADARRRATHAAHPAQDVTFELALDPSQVTVEVARRITALGLEVRLRCGELDPRQLGTGLADRPWLPAEGAVRLLLGAPRPAPPPGGLLPVACPDPALTVQCVLVGPARLIELWRWAKATGVRRLDAIRLEDSGASSPASAAQWREHRQDLQAIYEETCGELAAGRLPVEFQPLTRVVRRLAGNDARAALPLQNGYDAEGWRGFGAGGPFDQLAMLDPRQLPELAWMRLAGPSPAHRRADASPVVDRRRAAPAAAPDAGFAYPPYPPDPPYFPDTVYPSDSPDTADLSASAACPCQSCWARQVCNHSAFVASPLGSEDPREPSRERCAAWSAEVETALRLHHQLGQIDAIQVSRFLYGEQGPALAAASLPVPRLLQPFGYGDLLAMKPS
jgi:hypothetical protein